MSGRAYARTRALHVERSIEAAQEIRSIERVVEATKPEVIARLRSRLAESMVKARSSKNKREVARLAAEIKSVPTTALAQILHDTAKSELASLEKRHEAHASMRLSRVGKALRDWRDAASGYLRPAMAGAATTAAPIVAGVPPRNPAPPTLKPTVKPKEHPMWASYEDIVDDIFKTPFQKYMWGVTKRYGQFILDNADPNVPGRTPMDLANKLIEAVKQNPAKAEEMIMSYQDGRQVPQPGAPSARPTPRGEDPAGAAEPVFKRAAAMPRPRPGEVKPHPNAPGPSPLESARQEPIVARPPIPAAVPAPAATDPIFPPRGEEPADPLANPKRKPREKKKQRQRAILAQRGPERS